LANGWQKSMALACEKLKAQVRSLVEHPFHVVKNIFNYKKKWSRKFEQFFKWKLWG